MPGLKYTLKPIAKQRHVEQFYHLSLVKDFSHFIASLENNVVPPIFKNSHFSTKQPHSWVSTL